MRRSTDRLATVTAAAAVLALFGALPASGQIMDPDSPGVGDPIPDVAVHDADGKTFRLSELRGDWAVIVSGCLT